MYYILRILQITFSDSWKVIQVAVQKVIQLACTKKAISHTVCCTDVIRLAVRAIQVAVQMPYACLYSAHGLLYRCHTISCTVHTISCTLPKHYETGRNKDEQNTKNLQIIR